MSEEQVIQVTNSSDLEKIITLTSSILGETCWKAYLGYGDELYLDIGDQIDVDLSSRLRTRVIKRGAWMLGSRGTAWKLFDQNGNLIIEEYENRDEALSDEIQQKIQLIVDSHIVTFVPTYPNLGLELKFSNDCKLHILPTTEDDKWDVEYWQLAMPHGWLDVGPTLQWTYIPNI
jgi:hypothetical protein